VFDLLVIFTFDDPSLDSIVTSSPLVDSYSFTSPFVSIRTFVCVSTVFVEVPVELKLFWILTFALALPSFPSILTEVEAKEGDVLARSRIRVERVYEPAFLMCLPYHKRLKNALDYLGIEFNNLISAHAFGANIHFSPSIILHFTMFWEVPAAWRVLFYFGFINCIVFYLPIFI